MSTPVRLVAGVALAAVVLGVLAPALSFELVGDDYQMAQLARAALRSPARLLAPIGEFFRPTSTWLLALDRLLWGTDPRGYHAVTLLLHLLAATLLVAAASRLGAGPAAAWIAGLVWAVSPFACEVAVWTAVRHEQTLLLAWLTLILLWPAPPARWSRARIAGVVAAVALAAASKETWVVTPGLVAVLALSVERAPLRRAAHVAGAVAGIVGLYLLARFLAFPTFGGYYSLTAAPLAKVPAMLAAFVLAAPWDPAPTSVSPFAWVAAVAVAGALAAGRRRPAVAVGAALVFLPLLPVLFVPFMPLRYAHIPFAGFVLAVAGLAGSLQRLAPPARRVAAAVALAAVLAVGAVWVVATRATLVDFATVSRATGRLLAQTRSFAPELPLDRPVVAVRLDHENTLAEVARFPHGWAQPWFARHDDPAALVDAAALFEWVLDDPDVVVRRLDDWTTSCLGVRGAVIVHGPEGFRTVEAEVEDTAAAASRWSAGGARLRVVRVERR